MDQKLLDLNFMREALFEAQKAFEHGEIPVGAILVLKSRVIARTFNQVELLQDSSAHAELLCIRKGSLLLKNWRLLETTLYTTLEPCLMCVGALLLSRVARVVWGAPNLRYGACKSVLTNHKVRIEGGVMKKESNQILREFFKKQREKNHMNCVVYNDSLRNTKLHK